MFTGLIEELGRIERKGSGTGILNLRVGAQRVTEDLRSGSSIALNGVCLTVTRVAPKCFSVDVSEETRETTTLASLKVGEFVNLERAMSADGRFGGHISTGHVDGITKITGRKRRSGSTVFDFELKREFVPFIVEKGSVGVDGVSLTILKVERGIFSVNIIPHTLQSTTFAFKKVADRVNIELDIIGKYVVNSLRLRQELGK